MHGSMVSIGNGSINLPFQSALLPSPDGNTMANPTPWTRSANIRIVHPIDRLALRGPLLPGHATRPGSTRLAGVKHRVGK